MSEKNEVLAAGSEHAFPHLHLENSIINLKGGLSKREYFAGLAMQGFCANSEAFKELNSTTLVDCSLKCADALLKALEGGSDE